MAGSFSSCFGKYAPSFLFMLVFLLAVLPAHSKSTPVHAPGKSFYDTGMRLCDVDDQGNCHNDKYALEVAKFGSGGAAAAALSLLAFLVFLPVRSLCGGFGGKTPSYGCCCPSTAASREYTRNEILAVKIAVGIITIPIIIGVAIGFQANSDISSSIGTITTSLVNSGDNITLTLEQTRDILLSLPITQQSAITINSTVQTAEKVSEHLHNAHDTIDKYDDIRKAIMIVGFAFSLTLVLGGILCVIFNMRLVALFFGMIGLLVLTTIWISFAIHLVADKFVFDACTDINLLTSNATESNTTSVLKTGALANLWNCGENSDFALLQTLITQATDVAANQTCALRANYCGGDPNWICSQTPACSASTLETVIDAQHMTIIDGAQSRSLQECATSCTNQTNQLRASAMVLIVSEYTNYTSIYENTVLPLITCTYAADVLDGIKPDLCDTLFNSLFGVAVSNLIVGIFYIAFVILMVVGYKRFESFSGGLV
jgi:uncharacterized membrane protein